MVIIPLKMTEPIVPPVDPNEPVEPEPVEPVEDDEELDPEADPVPPQDETPEQLKARLAQSEEARRKLFARLQREKGKTKTAPTEQPQPQQPASPATLTREEGILFSKGFSEEEVEQAKKVAALQGVKLTEAVNDDLFTGWKTKRDKEATDRKAQLPSSRGGRPTVRKSFNTPGLSDEEHKQMFQDKFQG
jgi:hypothetical protein